MTGGGRAVVVALTGSSTGDELVRRAARLAQRSGCPLVGVHVARIESRAEENAGLDEHRRLLVDLGGTYHEVISDEVADALVRFARAEGAIELVVGSSRRSRWTELTRGSVVNAVVDAAGDIDVHVIGHADRPPGTRPGDITALRRRGGPRLPRRRRLAGWALVLSGIPLLTAVLASLRPQLNLTSSALVYLLLVTVTAVVGGARPALSAAVLSSFAVNWFFTPPLHTLGISSGENLLALVIFLAVAALVSMVVSQATRRGAAVAKARAEAEALARVAGGAVGDDDALAEMVTLLRTTFGFDGVTVLDADPEGDEPDWVLVEASGSAIASSPGDGVALALGDSSVLVLAGAPLTGDDRHLLEVFVAQMSSALERRRLRAARRPKRRPWRRPTSCARRSCGQCPMTCARRWHRSRPR